LQAVQTVGRQLQDFLARGAGGLFPEGSINLNEAIPRFATVFGSAARLLAALSEMAINVVIIAFLAVFFAWQPSVYRSGFLALLPPDKRSAIGRAIDRAANAVRKWIAGQAISMMVVFFATLISLLLVGMPYAVLLAFISGVLTFVPTLGPFLSGIAIVIAGLSESVELGLYGLGVYVLIQFVETYLITPLVQNEAVHLPPAATLGAQLVGGAIFGTLGFAFAVPLAAALRALVLELYVDRMESGSGPPIGYA
jgi:predicted PurR-regulated permease PerM